MLKYYKNIFTSVSMFAWPEAWWTDLSMEKKALIETVNSIELTQKQLDEIKSEINTKWVNVEDYNINIWRKWEIAKINWAANKDELSRLQNKYTELQNQIEQESRDNRESLSGSIEHNTGFKTPEEMIANLTAETEKKYRESANISIFPSNSPTISTSPEYKDTSASKESETTLSPEINTEKKVKPSFKENVPWVKRYLEKDFVDINNPTKEEIVKVLKTFQYKKFDWKKWPEWWTSAIFAIQWALQLLWNNITVDWMYWRETKNIIEEFQTSNNLKPDWIPGEKTITALLKSLEK